MSRQRLTTPQRNLLTSMARVGEMHARGVLDALDSAGPRLILTSRPEGSVPEVAAIKAVLDLGTLGDGKLDTVVEATTAGAAGNDISVVLSDDGEAGTGVVVTDAANLVTITYEAGVSTVLDVETAITALVSGSVAVKTAGTAATVLALLGENVSADLTGGVKGFSDVNKCLVEIAVSDAAGKPLDGVKVLIETVPVTAGKGTIDIIEGRELLLANGAAATVQRACVASTLGRVAVTVEDSVAERVLVRASASGGGSAFAVLDFSIV